MLEAQRTASEAIEVGNAGGTAKAVRKANAARSRSLRQMMSAMGMKIPRMPRPGAR